MSDEAITITGLKEVQKNLYAYSQQMGDRVVRGALRQGANYVLKGIRNLVPVKTGLLKRRGFRVANSRIHNGRHSSDLIGVYKYQHPDSVRELSTEHAVRSNDPVFNGITGPLRLELINGRLVRWFAVAGATCPSGKTRSNGRRSIVYRWAGERFVVDRIDETPPGSC